MFAVLRASRSKLGRRLAAAGLAVFAVVALATQVFACTAIMGPLYFSPSSGPAGSVVRTSVTGLKPFPARYNMYFGGQCMTFTGKLLKVITTDMNGSWSNVKVTIPANATAGTHSLCGVESYPTRGQTATSHSTWTVV